VRYGIMMTAATTPMDPRAETVRAVDITGRSLPPEIPFRQWES
jgi:hypothetical protein